MEQETASLTLNTFDINPSLLATDYDNTIDNQFGTISNSRLNFTWKHINMRLVLGEMYDRYETFNIYLYQISQTGGLTGFAPTSAPYQLVDVKMKGLPFLNNTYNFKTQNNSNSAYLTSYLLNNGSSGSLGNVTPLSNPTVLTFSKCADRVDINIDIKSTNTQNYPVLGGAGRPFGNFIYMFKIYGIPSRTNIITNGVRM